MVEEMPDLDRDRGYGFGLAFTLGLGLVGASVLFGFYAFLCFTEDPPQVYPQPHPQPGPTSGRFLNHYNAPG